MSQIILTDGEPESKNAFVTVPWLERETLAMLRRQEEHRKRVLAHFRVMDLRASVGLPRLDVGDTIHVKLPRSFQPGQSVEAPSKGLSD